MSIIQYLYRKADNPFIFKGKAFTNAVLALSSFTETAVSRPCVVRIEARVFADASDMYANFDDFMKCFVFEFTPVNFKAIEYTLSNAIVAEVVNESINIEALNLPQGLAMFEYDTTYKGGKRLSSYGLQAILQMPSVTENNTLADEWQLQASE